MVVKMIGFWRKVFDERLNIEKERQMDAFSGIFVFGMERDGFFFFRVSMCGAFPLFGKFKFFVSWDHITTLLSSFDE